MRPTSTTPAACPTTGAPTDNLQHVPPPTAATRATSPTPGRRVVRPARQGQRLRLKASEADLAVARKQVHVQSLVAAYRFLGSRWADLDPLKRTERPKIPELEPAFYDLTESDMDITFSAANTYFTKAENMTCGRSCRLARNLLQHHRRRVHALHRPGRALVAGAAGVDPASLHRGREAPPSTA